MPRDYSLQEVADRLGVHYLTVWRWVQKGNVFPNVFRVNPYDEKSPYRIPEQDLEEFESARKRRPV